MSSEILFCNTATNSLWPESLRGTPEAAATAACDSPVMPLASVPHTVDSCIQWKLNVAQLEKEVLCAAGLI